MDKTHAVMAYLLLFGGHNCDVGFSEFVAKIFEFFVRYARSGNPRSVLLAAMMVAVFIYPSPIRMDGGWRKSFAAGPHCKWLRDLLSDRP